MNFIFVGLCDNDFECILDATEFVFKNKEVDLTEEDFKFFVIEFMIGYLVTRRIHPMFKRSEEEIDRTRKYLEKSIKVSYLDKVPEVDHDGGSAVLNVHTGQSWRI